MIIAGFLGAWLGDNALYWIARSVPGLPLAGRESAGGRAVQEGGGDGESELLCLVIICRFLPFVSGP